MGSAAVWLSFVYSLRDAALLASILPLARVPGTDIIYLNSDLAVAVETYLLVLALARLLVQV